MADIDGDMRFFDSDALNGLSLEEPSSRVDRVVLSYARGRLPEIRAAQRRVFLLRLFSAAAILLVAIGLFGATLLVTRPGTKPGGDQSAESPARGIGQAMDLVTAVEQLRTDIEQIDEMTELIPDELDSEQEEIAGRIRACLDDLEKLEKALGKERLNSFNYHPQRKEINV